MGFFFVVCNENYVVVDDFNVLLVFVGVFCIDFYMFYYFW